jgi:putative transposase
MNARGHLIDAIRNISPGDLAASRKRLATLIEVPRIRQTTGNIVDLVQDTPSSVTLGDFIANDRARLTSLDQEILSSRPDPGAKPAKSALERRREHAATGHIERDAPARKRLPMAKGGYQ